MPTAKKQQSAFMRPVGVSDALAKIVGKGPLPRTEITKKVWEYIRKHKLQDTKNKRMINPDETLGAALGTTKQTNMFEMTKLLSKQIREPQLASR